jgi:hypothetical protein
MDWTNLMSDDQSNLPQIQPSVWRKRLLIAAEVLLVLIIVGLLIATWLPAFIGARPGVAPRQ